MAKMAFLFILINISCSFCLPQSKKAELIKIEDINSTFISLSELGYYLKERGEFETIDEFKKKQSRPYDTSKVHYFKVTKLKNHVDKLYKYNIDNEVLTFTAGITTDSYFEDYKPLPGLPIIIMSGIDHKDSYQGQNSYGSKVIVEKYDLKDYVVNLTNPEWLPDSVFDHNSGSISLSIKRPPNEAKLLCEKVSIVIGLKLYGPLYSAFRVNGYHDPTIDDPRNWTSCTTLLDAKIASLLLYDNVSKIVLLKISP